MKHPLLHARTAALLQLYLQDPAHALLITGPSHSGKTFVAKWLCAQMESEYTLVEKGEKQAGISIDQVRQLYTATKTGRNQVVIIKDAHTMSREAQNAFLKLLEEPPENTYFILTAESQSSILQTIRSRTQHIALLKPTKQQFEEYFNDTSVEFTQLVQIAKQRTALITMSIEDEKAKTELLQSMDVAKRFYQASHYERHIQLIAFSYEKGLTLSLIENLLSITKALTTAKSTDRNALKKLVAQTMLLMDTKKSLEKQSGNPKIHLTKLAEML